MFRKFTGRQRGLFFAVLTAVLLLVTLLLNLLLPYLQRAAAVYIDLTPEGLYTVSDLMKKEMGKLSSEITVTFCTEEDYLLGNNETRYIYIMAKKLEKEFSNIHVKTVNVQRHPEAVDAYRTTRLTEIKWDDVIIGSGSRYRIMNAKAFWSAEEGKYTNFNGEYKLATAMFSLAAFKDAPTACFVRGHGELYYDPQNADHPDNAKLAAFVGLLEGLGLKVATVDLEREEIPEDCVLLMMDGPKRDYAAGDPMDLQSISAVEKIDRYLAGNNAFLLFCDPDAGELPVLNEYLETWGIRVRNDVVRDKTPTGALLTAGGDAEDAREYLIAAYATASKGTIGYTMYQEIAGLATAPKTILERCSSLDMTWGDLGTRIVAHNTSRCVSGVFFSADTSVSYTPDGLRNVAWNGPYTLAAVSTESRMGENVDYYNSYVFVSGTTRLIDNDYLNSTSCCNYDTLFAILRNISRTDVYADSDLGGLTLNSKNYGGKELWDTTLSEKAVEFWDKNDVRHRYPGFTPAARVWLTVLVALPVAVIPVLGIVLHTRRKNR